MLINPLKKLRYNVRNKERATSSLENTHLPLSIRLKNSTVIPMLRARFQVVKEIWPAHLEISHQYRYNPPVLQSQMGRLVKRCVKNVVLHKKNEEDPQYLASQHVHIMLSMPSIVEHINR